MQYKKLTKFKITKNALDKIKEIQQTQQKDNQSSDSKIFLRIMIDVGGCAGMKYHIIIDDFISEEDFILTKYNKPMLVIDSYSVNYLKNGELDYYEDLNESSFKINNPNASYACSCGSSFNSGCSK